MRVISPFLKRVVYPSLGKAGYLRRRSDSFLSVVTYHGVLSRDYKVRDQFLDSTLVSIENFRAQLRFLKSDYHVISCDEFRTWLTHKQDLPPRAVLVTCDDGLLNNLTEMLPVLQEEGLDCLFFVTGTSVGDERAMLWYVELYLILTLAKQRPVEFRLEDIKLQVSLSDFPSRRSAWLDLIQKLSVSSGEARRVFLNEAASQCGLQPDWKLEYFEEPLRNRFALLAKSDLQKLRSAGMTLGAHSLSHPILKVQTLHGAEREIAGSRQALLEITDSLWAFAYPFGDYASVSERELHLAEKAGFECAFVNTEGTLSENTCLYALPRVHVAGDMGLREFEAHLTGFHMELRRRFA